MNIFTDDAKIMRKVANEGGCVALNQDLDRIIEWSWKWEMTFNTKKCSALEFGKNSGRISGNFSLSNERIRKKTEEKDLGVTITDKITFGSNMN